MFLPLWLEPNGKAVSKNPFSKRLQRHFAPNRRKEDSTAVGEVVFGKLAFGPVVISAVGEDELDLVLRGEVAEVGVTVLVGLAAARGFDVHDLDDARVHVGNVLGAAGFEQDGETEIAEPHEQGKDVGLEERFTSGNLDEGIGVSADLDDDLVEAHRNAFHEGVVGVAPGATQPATCQSHKDARQPGVGGLALDAVEYLVDDQGLRHAAKLTEADGLDNEGLRC